MHPYHPQSRISLFICLLLALPAALPLRAQQEEPPAVAIVPQDGFNMKIVDIVDTPERMTIVTTLDPPVFNWFAGTFTNLPTDKEVTIGLNMTGMDTPPNKADVSKWVGLRPVMTYADPTKYETYEWFQKDEQGRWVSGDVLKTDDEKFAGTGKVPIQQVISEELAIEFLSKDGNYWQAWREIETVEVLTNLNIIRIKQHFRKFSASIAMRVPYTYNYQQQFIDRIKVKELPGVFVDEIGITPEMRKLQLIRFESSSPTAKSEDQYTVLLIAREHATEHVSSWVLHGALLTLLQSSLSIREINYNITWIFILIEDPDGSANSIFDRLTNAFRKPDNPNTPPEVFNYASYFSTYATIGHTIDVVVNLHGIEANEGPNFFTPFINENNQSITCTGLSLNSQPLGCPVGVVVP